MKEINTDLNRLNPVSPSPTMNQSPRTPVTGDFFTPSLSNANTSKPMMTTCYNSPILIAGLSNSPITPTSYRASTSKILSLSPDFQKSDWDLLIPKQKVKGEGFQMEDLTLNNPPNNENNTNFDQNFLHNFTFSPSLSLSKFHNNNQDTMNNIPLASLNDALIPTEQLVQMFFNQE